MERKQTVIPLAQFTYVVGPIQRHIILFFYCLYALVTSSIMFMANVLLYICEAFVDLVNNLYNIPNQINYAIGANNAQLLSGKTRKPQAAQSIGVDGIEDQSENNERN